MRPVHFDCAVLGAGMVGLGTALHLLDQGRSVVLLDRRPPAQETSFGNAGLIQSEAFIPYAFPRSVSMAIKVLAGRSVAARLHWPSLPWIAPWLWQYFRAGSPPAVMASARALAPLVRRALPEHRTLMEACGVSAWLHQNGYLRLFRAQRELEAAARDDARAGEAFGLRYELLDRSALERREPHLGPAAVGALFYPEPARVADPGDLGTAYATLFVQRGGVLRTADARSLKADGKLWWLDTTAGAVHAEHAIIALGPWSAELLARQGVHAPLAVKRGYHRHYRAADGAVPGHLLVDDAHGFVLTPNKRGLRLTSGVEFARQSAAPSPVQLERAEVLARRLFPLGDRFETHVWVGCRPCMPDLVPLIGPVPGHRNLWVNTAHQHLGFTLGPVTGRLVAELVTGASPFTDPLPYRLGRRLV